jgi:hypothetical protein
MSLQRTSIVVTTASPSRTPTRDSCNAGHPSWPQFNLGHYPRTECGKPGTEANHGLPQEVQVP